MRFDAWTFDIIALDVTAGAERSLAGAGEDSDAQLRIVPKLLPIVSEQAVSLDIACIEPFRPVDRDVGERPFFSKMTFIASLPCSAPFCTGL